LLCQTRGAEKERRLCGHLSRGALLRLRDRWSPVTIVQIIEMAYLSAVTDLPFNHKGQFADAPQLLNLYYNISSVH